MIVSSRAPLRIAGEQEFAVPPLPVPAAGTTDLLEIAGAEAVRLFLERAMAVRQGFTLTAENAAAVAEIVRRLDGLPLAIELAAARVRILTPSAMVARLDDRLGLLSAGGRDLPERQRTLRGAIDWSHDLLDVDSRRLFARLSVFQGGGTFATAEAVCGADDAGTPDLDVLAGIELLARAEPRPDPRRPARRRPVRDARDDPRVRGASGWPRRASRSSTRSATATPGRTSSSPRRPRPPSTRRTAASRSTGSRTTTTTSGPASSTRSTPRTASRRRASCGPCSASGTCAATSSRAAPAPTPCSP